MLENEPCCVIIKQINNKLEKMGNNLLRSQDLTMSQLNMLSALSQERNKVVSLKVLEHNLHVAQPTAAGIVNRLESKGFVKSYGNPEDKRVKMVRITELGEKCCILANKSMEETEMKISSEMSSEEKRLFINLLLKENDSLQ